MRWPKNMHFLEINYGDRMKCLRRYDKMCSTSFLILYGCFLCLFVLPSPVVTLIPRLSSPSELNCDLSPAVQGRTLPKRPGDNGFSVKLEGQPQEYEPEKTYTVTLRSTHPVTFRGFALAANHVDDPSLPAGSFKVLNPWATKPMSSCSHVVTHATTGKKTTVQFVWTAPPTSYGCVRIKASVIQKGSIWYRNDGDLSLVICEATAPSVSLPVSECCACGTAQYRMTFYGIWSPQTHPKDYPEYSTHWSNVIGASHSNNYVIWDYGLYASDGVKKVAEWGWPNSLEDEIRGQEERVLSVIKTRSQWPAHQPRNIRQPPSSVFHVDSTRHLVSLLTMLGPSPDWNVGITKESMCTAECGWEGEKVFDLTPWDAGTDSGVSYLSPNSPTNPPDKIRALTSSDDTQSPFYDPEGGPISPVARVVITRLDITGEQCGPSPDVVASATAGTEADGESRQIYIPDIVPNTKQSACMYSEWTEWSLCEVTCGWGITVRTKMLKNREDASSSCESKIMEKEICRGSGVCENEDQSTVCLYSDWTQWSECSASCGNDALRFRTRILQWPSEASNCREPLKEMRFDCSNGPCDATPGNSNCRYSEWSDWMPCSEQCGVGETLRKRFALSGDRCESPSMETSTCMSSVDCNPPVGFDVPDGCSYSPWTGWMPCPVTCGVGQTFRKRVLASSTPEVHCDEVQMDTTKCMTSQSCEVAEAQICEYSEWSDWMPCSESCDVGKTLRKRFLKSSPVTASCEEFEMVTEKCYMPPCRVMGPTHESEFARMIGQKNCIYGPWTAWMPCSVSCGRGETLRKRFLEKALDISRNCEGFEMETNRCTVPVSCEEVTATEVPRIQWTQWTEWTSCSVTCGVGMRYRMQSLINCPELSSPDCVSEKFEKCSLQKKCPVDCLLGEWSEWSTCSSCRSTKISRRHSDIRRSASGTSLQIRTRSRLQKPKFGGASCDSRKEKRKCVCV